MTAEERVNRACFDLMESKEFEPLRLWWERDVWRSVLPAGPVDTTRLAMAQGDRERYLQIMARAEAHRVAMRNKEPT